MKSLHITDALASWKNSEIGYCAELVRKGGDTNVSRGSIADYLDLQATSARRDGRNDVAQALEHLRREWDDRLQREGAVAVVQAVAVIHEPTLRVVARFGTVAEAEAYIAELEKTQPDAVHRGEYGIDTPEEG